MIPQDLLWSFSDRFMAYVSASHKIFFFFFQLSFSSFCSTLNVSKRLVGSQSELRACDVFPFFLNIFITAPHWENISHDLFCALCSVVRTPSTLEWLWNIVNLRCRERKTNVNLFTFSATINFYPHRDVTSPSFRMEPNTSGKNPSVWTEEVFHNCCSVAVA